VKFLADECVDRQIVDRLRQGGHEVLYVMEMEPGISDAEVLCLTNLEKSILVTADKDFGELIFRQGKIAKGVILVRLAGLSPEVKAEVVVDAVKDHAGELLQAFTVITPVTVRVRRKFHNVNV
jgi:predicted nuclease of predicted toxin-antitoxin system